MISSMPQKQPEKAAQSKNKVQVTTTKQLETIPPKVAVSPSETAKPEKTFPLITIDESKLEHV
jgi:hypothetical protein